MYGIPIDPNNVPIEIPKYPETAEKRAQRESREKERRQARRPVPRTALEAHAQQLQDLFEQVDTPVELDDSSASKAPPDFVRSYGGSVAAAGSGDFHVYRSIRRREMERMKEFEQEAIKEEERERFDKERAEALKQLEDRTAKKRSKRQKQKDRKRAKSEQGPLIEQSLKEKAVEGEDKSAPVNVSAAFEEATEQPTVPTKTVNNFRIIDEGEAI